MRVAAGALFVSIAPLAVAPAPALPGEDNALMKLQLFSDHGEHDALCRHMPSGDAYCSIYISHASVVFSCLFALRAATCTHELRCAYA